MTHEQLDRRLRRIVIDLEELAEDCQYEDEKTIKKISEELKNLYLT